MNNDHSRGSAKSQWVSGMPNPFISFFVMTIIGSS